VPLPYLSPMVGLSCSIAAFIALLHPSILFVMVTK
jgi:hypothetical protein